MKKCFGFLFAMVLILGCAFLLTPEAEAATEGDYTYTVSDGKATITKCSTTISGDVTIPSTLGGYPVTAIDKEAFVYCKNMTSLTIPASIVEIGRDAFYGCNGMQSVTFETGSQLTTLGKYAFAQCTALAQITIPASVTTVEGYTFYYCSSLQSVSFEEDSKLGRIGTYMFYKCAKLETITIPASVTEIGSCAFPGCGLQRISFAENSRLATIGEQAFSGCDGLTTVTIPASVTKLMTRAFYSCDNLTGVNFEAGSQLATIGEYAFYECKNLTSIRIPDSVTGIKGNAFGQCDKMTAISFGENSQLTELGEDAFFSSGLKSIVIPKGVTVISEGLFSYCESLSSVTMHEGVTEIGNMAFYNSGISRLEIPSSVNKIGSSVFWDCKLSYNTYKNGNYLGNRKNPYLLLIESQSTAVSSFNIHPDTKLIYNSALKNCSSLTELTIPEGVVYIGGSAFRQCSSLEKVHIPEGLTDLGYYAFSGCSSLTEITIPEGVTVIKYNTFYDCSNLTKINIPEKVTAIEEYAFYGCSKLTELSIPEGVTSIGRAAFKNCSSLTEITIPEGVTYCGQEILSGCSSLTKITFSTRALEEHKILLGDEYCNEYPIGYFFGTASYANSVGVKQPYTYYYIEPESEKYVWDDVSNSTFYIPTALKEVYVSGGKAYTGIFRNCSTFQITVSQNLTGIEEEAFYACTGLKEIQIPQGVVTIPRMAFYGCTGLEEVFIPKSVTGIELYAFYGCTALETVTYEGTPKQWELVKVASENDSLKSAALICLEEDQQEDDWLTQYLTCAVYDGTVAITGCDQSLSGDITLPSVISGYPVATIEKTAFQNCTALTSITIPASVTTIESGAFFGCSSLKGIWVEEGNPNYSSDVQGVLFNNAKTALLAAPGGFAGAYTILEGVTAIGDYAFDGCKHLTGIFYMEDGLKSIGSYAFRNCTGLKELNIPGTVTTVGDYVYYGCTGITEVVIPSGVTAIGKNMFAQCTALKEVTIAQGGVAIGAEAFYGCTALEQINHPNGLGFVGSSAFYGSCIAELVITGYIESGALWGCGKLENLTVSVSGPEATKNYTIEGYWLMQAPFGAFFNGPEYEGSIKTIQYVVGDYWDYDMSGWCLENETRSVYYLPATLKHITFTGTAVTKYAFYNVRGIASITFTKNLTKIGQYAFYNCGLKDVYYEGPAEDWQKVTIGNGNTGLTKATLHTVEPQATELSIINLPNKTVYYQGSELDTTGLVLEAVLENGKTVTVTEGYTISGYDANLGGIQTVQVTYAGATVTFQVEVKLFYVTGISISQLPQKVEYWEGDALDMSGLALSAMWTDGIARPITGGYTISGYDANTIGDQTITMTYEEYTVSFTVTVKALYVINVTVKQLPQKLECWLYEQPDTAGLALTVTWANGKEETVTDGYTISMEHGPVGKQPVTVTYRELSTTYEVEVKKGGSCGENLTWQLDENGVLTITGTGAMTDFANSDAVVWRYIRDEIKKVIIEKGVTTIGTYTFSYCGNLTEITIPFGVTAIGSYAFERTHALKEVKLPAGLETMGSYLFYRSEGLQNIVIPDSVTSLGASAFSRCINLEQVAIGAGITQLGRYTFYTCTSLTAVTVPDGITIMGDQVFENCSSLTTVTLSRHLTAIGKKSFSGCTALQDVHYRNTAANWAQITMGATNEPLLAANLHTCEEMTLAITGQPKSVTAQTGDTVTFTVIAEGDGLTYKWQYRNAGSTAWTNTSLAGAKTNTLILYNVQGSGYHGRQFRCVITDANGNTVTTEPAVLTVPYLVKNAATAFGVPVNTDHQFTVAFSVTEGVTYQWQYKGNTSSSTWANTGLPGNKTNTLTVNALSTRNGYSYRCIIKYNGQEIVSKAAILYVASETAVITKQPTDASAVCGDYAVFSIEARGEGALYQWQWYHEETGAWVDTKIAGYHTNTLKVKTNNFNGGRLYRCRVRTVNGSGWNEAFSESATLTVLPAAEVSQQPQNVTVKAGGTATFRVTAKGEGLTYQWQWAKYPGNWKNTTMAGATTNTLTISNVTKEMNGRYYRVIITNRYGGTITTEYVQLLITK